MRPSIGIVNLSNLKIMFIVIYLKKSNLSQMRVNHLCYHANDPGSTPLGGHTNKSPHLLPLLDKLNLPSFRGW